MNKEKRRRRCSIRRSVKAVITTGLCTWVLVGTIACSNDSTNTSDNLGINVNPIDAAVQPDATHTAAQAGSTAGFTNGNPVDSTVPVSGDGATSSTTPKPDASIGPTKRDAAETATDAALVPAQDAGESIRDAMTADATLPDEQTCPPSVAGLQAGNSAGSLMHGGQNRTYLIHVPAGIDNATPVPVVLDFHGYSRTPASQQAGSGWDALADREKFLVVYPEGIGASWNVDDTCCGTAGSQVVDDVGFTKALIEHLAEQACIDKKRIYASGVSNGGGFAHRLGCEAADVIAAVAPVSTDLRTQPCTPARPISVMAFRGLADTLEPYEGGLIGPPGGQYTSPGAKGSLELWRDIDQCTGTPTTIDQYCESYTECADGVEADLCSLPNVGHAPYVNSLGFSVVETAWKMFARQPMR